jgi:retron-type reverse transcriptase
MKRANHLFESIVDYQNIRLAFLKAIRGNRKSPAVCYFCRNIENNLTVIRNKLSSLKCDWGNYRSFSITDPKPRQISTAPFEQRIMHHALMNILEPVFDRSLIYHSYACRKGKGTHAAVLYAFTQCKKGGYFLKLDVRKYFDSIDHEILKNCIAGYIKDARVLFLLQQIIDSYRTAPGKGVPIGNLTSQFFANLYLSSLDHFVLEKLHPAGRYCRYMDDVVVWASSKDAVNEMLTEIHRYVESNLALRLKNPVCGHTKYGLPFLGFLIKEKGIYLTQKSKRRITERITAINESFMKNEITEEKAAERALSVFAAINLARTRCLRMALNKEREQPPAATA